MKKTKLLNIAGLSLTLILLSACESPKIIDKNVQEKALEITEKTVETEETTLGLLQGIWEDTTDAKSVMEFRGNSRIDYYDGKNESETAFTLEESCESQNTNDENNDIILAMDGMCWQVASVNEELLELIYLNRGNVLTYKKIESVKTPEVNQPNTSESLTYTGTWFDVKYPAGFDVSGTENADEAKFTSPDKKVEFFVYSPQWGGNPAEYLNLGVNEELVSEKTDQNTYSATIKDKSGSYTRSYLSIKNPEGTDSETHKVFGIKYTDQAAYDKYKEAYTAFKNSLVQYAD
jgi:hypothetical protein